MTEEEAKTKWCPFARSPGSLRQYDPVTSQERTVWTGAQNRGYQMGGPLENCLCIGSVCMAWRWTSSFVVAVSAECVDLWEARAYEKTGTTYPDGTFEMRMKPELREGRCGLVSEA